MKKLFLVLALAGVMVACGGEKKDKKAEEANNEQQAPEMGDECCADECCADEVNIEQQAPEKGGDAVALAERAFEAMMNEDYDALEAMEAEFNQLSEAEQAQFQAEIEKLMLSAM